MFEVAGDLGLGDEPFSTVRIRRVHLLNLFEGHAAVQVGILRREDLSQAPGGVQPERLIAHAGAAIHHLGLLTAALSIHRIR